MQFINPNYPGKTVVKQIKIDQKKLLQSCTFYPIAKDSENAAIVLFLFLLTFVI